MTRWAWLLALAAALACWAVAGQPWVSTGTGPLTGIVVTDGAAQTLPLAAIAGIGLSRWLRSWGRRVALVLTAVVLAAAGPLALARTGVVVDEQAGTIAQPFGWVFLVLGLVGAAAAALAVVEPPPVSRAAGPAAAPDASLSAWQSLDAGLDPTAETGTAPVGTPEWGERSTTADLKEPG